MTNRSTAQWLATTTLLLAACGVERRVPETVQAGDHRAIIRMTDDMRFVPEHPTVNVGDTLIWINDGAMLHTSTDKPGLAGLDEHNILPAGAAAWDSGLMQPGEIFRAVFAVPGEYTYLCFLHEAAGMVGRITMR